MPSLARKEVDPEPPSYGCSRHSLLPWYIPGDLFDDSVASEEVRQAVARYIGVYSCEAWLWASRMLATTCIFVCDPTTPTIRYLYGLDHKCMLCSPIGCIQTKVFFVNLHTDCSRVRLQPHRPKSLRHSVDFMPQVASLADTADTRHNRTSRLIAISSDI